jgi:hypothetical protein
VSLGIFLKVTTFGSRRFPSRDDPDDFDIIFFTRRVRDDDKSPADFARRAPPGFAMFITTCCSTNIWIVEDQHRRFEFDPVLSFVQFGLSTVPFEPDFRAPSQFMF